MTNKELLPQLETGDYRIILSLVRERKAQFIAGVQVTGDEKTLRLPEVRSFLRLEKKLDKIYTILRTKEIKKEKREQDLSKLPKELREIMIEVQKKRKEEHFIGYSQKNKDCPDCQRLSDPFKVWPPRLCKRHTKGDKTIA